MAFPLRSVLFASVVVVATVTVFSKLRRERRHCDDLREKALEDSFPASDAPATQDFAIPINRQ